MINATIVKCTLGGARMDVQYSALPVNKQSYHGVNQKRPPIQEDAFFV